jgi:DNA-directed RNA polymerase subunit RPC12/RpoP
VLTTFACTSCHTHLAVDSDRAGKKIKCRHCDARVTVPQPELLEPEETAAARPARPFGRTPWYDWLLKASGAIALGLGVPTELIWLVGLVSTAAEPGVLSTPERRNALWTQFGTWLATLMVTLFAGGFAFAVAEGRKALRQIAGSTSSTPGNGAA